MEKEITETVKKEIENRIYQSLHEISDLNWHAWYWWSYHDSWFSQFTPQQIDAVAEEMAKRGIIERGINGGYRRIEKTWWEKFLCKISY